VRDIGERILFIEYGAAIELRTNAAAAANRRAAVQMVAAVGRGSG